jgi:hypothetical protein
MDRPAGWRVTFFSGSAASGAKTNINIRSSFLHMLPMPDLSGVVVLGIIALQAVVRLDTPGFQGDCRPNFLRRLGKTEGNIQIL